MKLIKINTDHYVVVDDSEIQEGDWYIDDTNRIRQAVMGDGLYWAVRNGYKKITHSTEPLGFLNEYGSTADLKCDWTNVKFLPISEVKELIGEVDVEKHWEYFRIKNPNTVGGFKEQYISFLYGYNQALEDNKEKKYTEMDMKKAFYKGIDSYMQNGDAIEVTIKDFRESLQPKTEWNVEFIDGKLKLNK